MMKKIFALVLAVVMVLAMGTTAFADTTVTDYAGTTQTTVSGNNIPLVKSIVFFNPDSTYAVREPNITYNYTIAPADVDDATRTVTDANSHSAVVKDGVSGGVSASASISFTDTTTVTASTSGVVKEESTNLTVTPSAFSAPGIYRYVITETTTKDNVEAVGIERDNDYVSTRYLDVYIRRNASDEMELYGAVIFRAESEETSITNTAPTTKTEGFDTTVTSGYESDVLVDKYYTYNLEVGKKVSGSLADKNHDFPFSVVLTGTLSNAVTVDVTNDGTYAGTLNATPSVSTTALTLTPKLSNGEKLTVKGLPAGTTAAVTETNDTFDTYTAAATVQTTAVNLDNDSTSKSIAKDATAALKTAANIQTKTAIDSIVFNNDLTEVSPTGVVLRIAPYAIMLAAGVTLFVVFAVKRRKNEEEAEA